MAAKKTTDAREELFCYYMAQLGEGREAAIRAGYRGEEAYKAAARLLMRGDIRRRMAKIAQEDAEIQARTLAIQGLRRLAFGPVNGGLALLAWEEGESPDWDSLDLFHVAEIRRPKGGGWEVRFFSRLEAMRMLLDCARETETATDKGGSFYQALELAAGALAGGDRDAV